MSDTYWMIGAMAIIYLFGYLYVKAILYIFGGDNE